ncbi:hypothetical protein PpBr36_03382 [Pyricularia pennisetigena]|uniref:hypothetical protein n=1 Tax=Pyricularia pennisetigena TaxID=1578925 RepID=UPI001153F6D0|nr:hypothetical protein PpBr36_03382 [Pyricularia pennisetigena]TLS30557.1 hypothetical protein PpBr36_03382 [Pyricularia pennisetigena]
MGGCSGSSARSVASSPRENNETFCFFLGASAGGPAVLDVANSVGCFGGAAAGVLLGLAAMLFLPAGFLATDSGRNISGLPIILTSFSGSGFGSADVEESAEVVPACCDLGGGRFSLSPPEPPPSSTAVSSSSSSPSADWTAAGSRLKAASELVLKKVNGTARAPPDADAVDLATAGGAVFFGAGRADLKLLKRPPPLPSVLARLAGGSSDAEDCGRLTTILPGLLRSISF